MKKKGNNIGWCDITVNPVMGCKNGCGYCYARDRWNRFKGMKGWCKDFEKPEFFPHRLKGFRTKEPTIIFIDSMSDIGQWEFEWFRQTVHAMYDNPHNIYLALTKSIGKYKTEKQQKFSLPSHFYVGATVTNNGQAQAVIDAGGADFISFEPLLEGMKLKVLSKLRCKWWIVGDLTKSGVPQGATFPWWVFSIADCAKKFGVPLFMKDSLKRFTEDSVRGYIQ